MKTDIVQEEPKLILKYPYQAKLNQVALVAIIAFALVVTMILKNLIQIGTDESDRMIIAIVVVCVPILLCLIACYLYLHAVKIEVDKDNIVKYYSFESRGHSVLHFGFKLEDVEEIKVRKYPFYCSKLMMKIKNPIFYGFCKKKLEKSLSISVIADREKVDFFIQEFLNRHSDKL